MKSSMLTSSLCTAEALSSESFQSWCLQLGEGPGHMHRKVWEWAFICQALQERQFLRPGMKGLGFAVGTEPLSAFFARMGTRILATDLSTEDATREGWVSSDQHTSSRAALNNRNLCGVPEFDDLVDFEFCDMNHIPEKFAGKFDFTWSSCALEHLGSISKGAEFIFNSMNCLRIGGVAVHTTEFNLSSNSNTVEQGGTVIFRQKDIEGIGDVLYKLGHEIGMNWERGQSEIDRFVDVPPYTHNPHLKLQLGEYTTTSIGLIIRKCSEEKWQVSTV